MSESIVERRPPFPLSEENGAPPSKKLKLASAPEQHSDDSTSAPQNLEDDPEFDPVEAILEAGRKCQQEEEERRRDEAQTAPEKPAPTSSNNAEKSKEKTNNNADTMDESEDDSEEDEELPSTPDDSGSGSLKTPSKKKKKKSSNMRRNIKDILKHDQLDDLTIAARKEEEERRQRMNLKLQQQQQQLRLLQLQQQQSQLLRESLNQMPNSASRINYPNFMASQLQQRGRYPMNHFPTAGFGDGNLLRKLIKKRHITVSLDAEGKPMKKEEAVSQDDDCILLSSDEEAEATTTANASRPAPTPTANMLSSASSQEPRPPPFNIADQALHSLLDKAPPKVVAEVTLSSGDEDSAMCAEGLQKRGSSLLDEILSERLPCTDKIAQLDSDDDCIILSPEPDEEEEQDDKDECSQDLLNVPDQLGRVLVNVGHPDEDEDIFLPPQIARIIKPHQIGGIRFLYDNVVESVDRYKTTLGFGCILAHAMGLGKTLQTVSFCDAFLRTVGKTVLIIVPINTIQNWLNEFNRYLPSKKAPCSTIPEHSRKRSCKRKEKEGVEAVVPPLGQEDSSDKPCASAAPSGSGNEDSNSHSNLNSTFDSTLNLGSAATTISLINNGDGECANDNSNFDDSTESFKTEEDVRHRAFDVLLLNETVKSLQARERIITTWSQSGGVLLIGYEMYRMLALKKLKKSTKKTLSLLEEEKVAEEDSLNRIYGCLVDPGPDCIICDEGHRIKNSGAGISQALKAIRTRRRVVLTGYPLQNNLMEYWCMVDFVRPNYLGTKAEFSNMFERPIQNGQCADSTLEDKRLMKFRSHVLHSLLEGFVQRRSHLVLKNALPQKEEWVFLVRLTPIQLRIYKEFIRYLTEDLESDNASANPIKAFAVCCKIWNHPDVLYNVVKKNLDLEMDLDLEEVRSVAVQKPRSGGGVRPRRGTGRPRGRPPLNGMSCIPSTRPIDPFDENGILGLGFGELTQYSRPEPTTSGISLEWAKPLFENYVPEVMENGVKFELLFQLIDETVLVGDKLLVFSQSLLTLDLIEIFLKRRLDWCKFQDYVRLDGSTAGLEREKLINEFNTSLKQKVFLISTRAGSLGINLVGANRVCIFDASWNPCHDSQAVCRVYRYGQTKPCFIYRFVSDCTLEKRIYDRQVNKKGMADRIVDEMNPNTPFKSKDVSSFLVLQHDLLEKLPFIKVDINLDKFEDPVLKTVLQQVNNKLTQEPFEHESLLIDQKHQRLSKSEKRLALKNYEKEKKTVANAYATYQRPSYTQYYSHVSNNPSSPYQSNYSASSNYPMASSRFSESFGNGSGYTPTSGGSVISPAQYPQGGGRIANLFLRSGAGVAGTSSSSCPSGSGGHGSSSGSGRGLQGNSGMDRFELHINALKTRGISVYPVDLKQDTYLNDHSSTKSIFIRAGERVYILVSQKGTYLRVQGKLLRVPYVGTEMTQELAESFVKSLLQAPSETDRKLAQIYPVEQQLPPSNSMMYQKNATHLQITNSRNNSGGDVMMAGSTSSSPSTSWQTKSTSNGHKEHKSSPQKSSSSSSSSSSHFPANFLDEAATANSLAQLAMAQASSIASHTDLQCLSRLAETVSQRSSPYHLEGKQWPASSSQDASGNPPSDLEVIKLNRSASSGSSSNSNSSNSRTNSPYVRQNWSSSGSAAAAAANDSNSSNWPVPPSGNSKDPSFYTDFTITPIAQSSGSSGVSGGDVTTTSSKRHHRRSSRKQNSSSPHSSSSLDKSWGGLGLVDVRKDPSPVIFPGQDLWQSFGGLAQYQTAALEAAAAALRSTQGFAGLDLNFAAAATAAAAGASSMANFDLNGSASPINPEADLRRINFGTDEQSANNFLK